MRWIHPKLLLRLEGAALFAGAVLLYREGDHSWLLLAVLVLAPDLSMLGYLGGASTGAFAYNLAHTTVVPIALGVVGMLADRDLAMALALIWLAHIGLDRALGYGLKYASGFKANHLDRL